MQLNQLQNPKLSTEHETTDQGRSSPRPLFSGFSPLGRWCCCSCDLIMLYVLPTPYSVLIFLCNSSMVISGGRANLICLGLNLTGLNNGQCFASSHLRISASSHLGPHQMLPHNLPPSHLAAFPNLGSANALPCPTMPFSPPILPRQDRRGPRIEAEEGNNFTDLPATRGPLPGPMLGRHALPYPTTALHHPPHCPPAMLSEWQRMTGQAHRRAAAMWPFLSTEYICHATGT